MGYLERMFWPRMWWLRSHIWPLCTTKMATEAENYPQIAFLTLILLNIEKLWSNIDKYRELLPQTKYGLHRKSVVNVFAPVFDYLDPNYGHCVPIKWLPRSRKLSSICYLKKIKIWLWPIFDDQCIPPKRLPRP